MLKEGMKATGRLSIVLKDQDGKVKETREVKNLVVDTGLDYIASRMKDATATAMTHLAVGTGSTAAAAGDTTLGTESHREALDSTTVTDNTVTYVCGLEAGEGTAALTEAGIFNASSGGTMLCRTVFDVVNKGANDTMTVTWVITISAS